MNDDSSLICATNIGVRHGSLQVLHNVSFCITPGEIVTIVGPNGSGKSTLVRALIGTQELSEGSINRAPDLRIGYVPQRLQLGRTMPMSVRRFFSLPSRVSAESLSEVAAKVQVEHLLDRQLIDLSGGQFQRVLLARALLNKPHILVLDEATQGLDQRGSAEFYHQIENVRNEIGCAVLMVSHELHVVMSASDRVICLNGHICCEGAPEVVSSQPEYRALFGLGTHGALALYRHEHDHTHDHDHDHDNDNDNDNDNDHNHNHNHNHECGHQHAGQVAELRPKSDEGRG